MSNVCFLVTLRYIWFPSVTLLFKNLVQTVRWTSSGHSAIFDHSFLSSMHSLLCLTGVIIVLMYLFWSAGTTVMQRMNILITLWRWQTFPMKCNEIIVFVLLKAISESNHTFYSVPISDCISMSIVVRTIIESIQVEKSEQHSSGAHASCNNKSSFLSDLMQQTMQRIFFMCTEQCFFRKYLKLKH